MGKKVVEGLVVWVLLAFLARSCAGVLFSSLERSLQVSAVLQGTSTQPLVVKAGEDHLIVSWSLNSTAKAADSLYRSVKLKLCFAPASQIDRKWRKGNNDLGKDKTCMHTIATQPYTSVGNTTNYRVAKDVPSALYFIRAYALNEMGEELAYGQTTNKNKTTNLFSVEPITGRLSSLKIATIVCSVGAIGILIIALAIDDYNFKKIR